MDNPSTRIIDFWFNYAARSIKFILQPVSKSTGTRKISRADSFCKNFEIFVCLKLKSCCFREDMRYDFRFSFFGSSRFLVAIATICVKKSVNSSYKTSLYEVQNNKFTFPKKVFGSKFCIIWSQKKLWKKRKSRNWEATVDSKMCFFVESDGNSDDFRGPLPSQKYDFIKFHFVKTDDFEWCFWIQIR